MAARSQIYLIGHHDGLTLEKIYVLVKKYFGSYDYTKKIKMSCAKLIDGMGAYRVVREMIRERI
jgi:hypothetical protein